MRSMGLFDATAASGWLSATTAIYLLLSSTKENGDISLCFLPLLGERGDLSRSVVLLDDQAMSPSVAVVEEGPRRSPYLSLSSPRRNRYSSISKWNDQEPDDSSFKRQKIKGYMLKVNLCLWLVDQDAMASVNVNVDG
ncbi:hypothetical protein Bca4012_071352 [Brassica carinata]